MLRVEDKLGQKHASDTCRIALKTYAFRRYRLGGGRAGLQDCVGNNLEADASASLLIEWAWLAAFECARDYATIARHSANPSWNVRPVAFRLADMATYWVHAARRMVLHLRRRCAEAEQTGDRHPWPRAVRIQEMAEVAQAATSADQQAGYGYLKDFPVERIYRDVRVYQIYEAATSSG